MYNINHVAQMTGLSTRTVRNYIKMGLLEGEKVDGVWQFTPEQMTAFWSHPTVRPSIAAKKNAIVYDFMAQRKKSVNSVCVILDLNADDQEAQEISEFFCHRVSEDTSNTRFSFEHNLSGTRVILSGPEDCISKILEDWYR